MGHVPCGQPDPFLIKLLYKQTATSFLKLNPNLHWDTKAPFEMNHGWSSPTTHSIGQPFCTTVYSF